jgi:hypothetical protein
MNTFDTSDLALAAYLHMMGVPLVKASSAHSGKFQFIFDDADSQCETLSYAFINSECAKFDNHVRMLKKMIYKT